MVPLCGGQQETQLFSPLDSGPLRLNKFYQREMFAIELAFYLARQVPKDTWKTVTDTWNGYHSVLLGTSAHHLKTFITPFGCWRYNSTDG